MNEIILMSDPKVAAIPVVECRERLVDVRRVSSLLVDDRKQQDSADTFAYLREGVLDRLSTALTDAGLVNYPTEWWHWSYGDRYWALMTASAAARYGPKDLD